MNYDFSDDQKTAMQRIKDWFRNYSGKYSCGNQRWVLAGLAGTGKTTILEPLLHDKMLNLLRKPAAVMSLTGKAVSVLHSKGLEESKTIHSTIYDVEPGDEGRISFHRKDPSELQDQYSLLVVDEASMIGDELRQDLESFGLPILYVGDHGQLEPIGRCELNLMTIADFRLERIHRQAAKSPILRAAYAFREGREVPYGKWENEDGSIKVIPIGEVWEYIDGIKEDIQVVCGLNRTRVNINRRRRMTLFGEQALTKSSGGHRTLISGDRIVCLQNNKTLGILNGQTFKVKSIDHVFDKTARITISDERGYILSDVPVLREQFYSEELKIKNRTEVGLFDHAYAMTCHKLQGSQVEKLIMISQQGRDWDMKRWNYTAITRASREALVAI